MRTIIFATALVLVSAVAVNFVVEARSASIYDVYGLDDAPEDVPEETSNHHGHKHMNHHHKQQKHHKAQRVPIAVYKKDEHGEEYLECASRDSIMGEETKIRCKVSEESSMGVKGLGLACMAVFTEDNEALKQGCWIHQEDDVLKDACQKNACIATDEGEGPYFCCCRGRMCNKNFFTTSVFDEKKRL